MSNCRFEYVAQSHQKDNLQEADYVITGKFAGSEHKRFLGTHTKNTLSRNLEDTQIDISELRLVVDLTISNASDLLIPIDQFLIRLWFAPKEDSFWLRYFHPDQGNWPSRCAFSLTYDLTADRLIVYHSGHRFTGYWGYVVGRKFIKLLRDFDKKVGGPPLLAFFTKVKVINQSTRRMISLKKNLVIDPKAKLRWQIIMKLSKPAAALVMSSGSAINPQEFEVDVLWEGDRITRGTAVEELYVWEERNFKCPKSNIRFLENEQV